MPGMRCIVTNCKNTHMKTRHSTGESRVSYFRFPKDEALCKLWAQRSKEGDWWNPRTSYVCSAHFKPEDFERNLRTELMGSKHKGQLKKGAVPSVDVLEPGGTSQEPPEKVPEISLGSGGGSRENTPAGGKPKRPKELSKSKRIKSVEQETVSLANPLRPKAKSVKASVSRSKVIQDNIRCAESSRKSRRKVHFKSEYCEFMSSAKRKKLNRKKLASRPGPSPTNVDESIEVTPATEPDYKDLYSYLLIKHKVLNEVSSRNTNSMESSDDRIEDITQTCTPGDKVTSNGKSDSSIETSKTDTAPKITHVATSEVPVKLLTLTSDSNETRSEITSPVPESSTKTIPELNPSSTLESSVEGLNITAGSNELRNLTSPTQSSWETPTDLPKITPVDASEVPVQISAITSCLNESRSEITSPVPESGTKTSLNIITGSNGLGETGSPIISSPSEISPDAVLPLSEDITLQPQLKSTEDAVTPELNYEELYNNLLVKHTAMEQEFLISKTLHLKKIYDLEREIKTLKRDSERSVDIKVRHVLNGIFTPNQITALLTKRRIKHWSDEDIARAYVIRCLSKPCYIFLRDEMKIPLPGISTIHRWAARNVTTDLSGVLRTDKEPQEGETIVEIEVADDVGNVFPDDGCVNDEGEPVTIQRLEAALDPA